MKIKKLLLLISIRDITKYYKMMWVSKVLHSTMTLKKDKVAVNLVLTGFPPLLIPRKILYGNAISKYF